MSEESMLLSEAIDSFLLFRRAENLSPAAITWYQHHLSVFAGSQPPYQRVRTVTSQDIALYLASQADPKRKPKPLAPYTVRARYMTLQAFFNWCEGSQALGCPDSPIGHGPHKAVKKPRTGTPATHYVPFEDYQRYIHSITVSTWQDARDRLLGIVLFWTGVRLQECVDLQVADIDTKRSLVLVREGKGRKARYIPFDNESVRPALLEYLYLRPSWPGPHLWIGQSNDLRRMTKPLRGEGIRQILIRRCRRAHIPYYNPHAWRHAFGMWMINSGASIGAVSLAMGHSSVQVTEKVYAQMQTPAMQREYAAAVAYIKERNGGRPSG